MTCIYVGWDGDEIVAGHLADHVKLRNIRRDPRVTLSVESDVQVEGFSPYVVIKGIAHVEVGGAVPVLRRITNGQFPPAWRQLARWMGDAHLASAALGNRPVGSRRLSPASVRTLLCSGTPFGRARAPWDENRVGPRGGRVRKANRRGEHVDIARKGLERRRGSVHAGCAPRSLPASSGFTNPSEPHHMALLVRLTVTCHEPPSRARLTSAALAPIAPM